MSIFSLFSYSKKVHSLKHKEQEFESKILESRFLLESAAQSTIDAAIEVTNELKNRIKDYTTQIQITSDLLSNPIITINSEGTIKTFNKAAHELFDTSGSEMVGFNISILFRYINGQDIIFENLFDDLQCGKQIGCFQQNNIKGRKFNGELFWVEVKCNEYFDSGGNKHYVILLYETDKKLTADNIFSNNILSADIFFIHNFSSIIDASSSFFEEFGYTNEDVSKMDVYKLVDSNYWNFITNDSYHENYSEIIHKTQVSIPVLIKSFPVLWREKHARMVILKIKKPTR